MISLEQLKSEVNYSGGRHPSEARALQELYNRASAAAKNPHHPQHNLLSRQGHGTCFDTDRAADFFTAGEDEPNYFENAFRGYGSSGMSGRKF